MILFVLAQGSFLKTHLCLDQRRPSQSQLIRWYTMNWKRACYTLLRLLHLELDGALFELHTLDSGLPYLNSEELKGLYA